METHGTGMGESETYAILFQHTPCYDLVPDSAKLILLDSQLTIGKAFKALIYNGIRAAPVWNSKNQNFISMLTVTDFVQMLNYCWNQTVPSNIDGLKNIQIDDVDQITIQQWKEESIFKALRLLLRFRLHHLPIMDSPFDGCGNILYVLTQRKLLTYMFEKLNKLPQPRFLQSSLTDLNIGTHGSILLVTPSTRLADALLLFRENCVTALPVVDSINNRRLVNIFSKFDVFTLVLNGAYKNPNLTIQEVLDICKTNTKSMDETQRKPPVEICLASNNLLYVMEKLVKTGYRSLVIVNNTNDYRVDGIISLSDVLRFTVLQQLRINSSRSQPPSVAEVVDERDELSQDGKQKKKKKLKKEKSFDTNNLLSTCSSETIIKSNDNNNNNKGSISSHDTPIICTLNSTHSNTTVNTIITTNTTKTPITITTVTGGVGSSPEHINTSSSHTIIDNVKINKSIKSSKLSKNRLDKSKINSSKSDSTNTSINIDLTTNNKNNNNNLCSDQIILSTVVSEKIT
ncbi:unnamed protein product [Schistosoma curassoni]|uniref:CBS domain-containing protein n=1 Tax=Schistosoma curassoni TaxID=6186 RepID=A0A183K605_9TREM|nr:unnamed protein product [Schistosoma curassoni]